MIETCPGMKIIKEYLSPSDLSEHYPQAHSYGADTLFYSIKKNSNFKSNILNPLTGKSENVLDVIGFGCNQVNIYYISID